MNIGERLKQLRLFLGKSQEEFAAGVISESYYSKVEREKSDLKFEDLLAILNKNQISLKDFLEEK